MGRRGPRRARCGRSAEPALPVFPQDGAGKQVRRLVDGSLGAGLHERVWDGTDDAGRSLTSGKYFLRLRAGAFVATGSLVLVR